MKQLVPSFSKFYNKLRNLYHNQNTSVYNLRVGDCYYCDKFQEYVAVLHPQDSNNAFTLSVREILSNPYLLSQIHPIQASSLNWVVYETKADATVIAANNYSYLEKDSSTSPKN